MADPRFAQPAAATPPPRFGPEEQSALFQAEPGAFENMYKLPKAVPTPEPAAEEPEMSSNMRMFGTEDPAKAYLDSAPLPRFVQAVKRSKAKTADRIQQYVDQHPEDRDLLNPAPLSSWAKSIGKGLAKVPFRVARFAGKYAIDKNPLNPMSMVDNMIPDSMFKTPTVEDSVTKIAAYIGLPLDKAQQIAGEKPTILQSLHDGFVKPVKEGFQISTMPNGPEREAALDAWAYKTSQSFVSGLTVGVLDEAMQENSIWMENGELLWRGVPIDDLTEMENKGVAAGQLTGQLAGSLVTYAVVSPMLTAQLRTIPALNQVYKAHPYLSSAIMTNAAEEGFEAVIRKGTGQSYTFNDTLIGMMSGVAFETGKLGMGGYKASPDIRVDLPVVRNFLEAEIRNYTIENGHTPGLNDLRARIGDKVIPGTDMSINQLHTMLANSGIKEARLAELKGGKKGRPGIDYSAEPPKPEGPDMNALIKKYGSEDAIPLHELDNVEFKRVQNEATVKALTEAQQKYVPGGGTKEQFKANTLLKNDPEAPKVIAESRGRFMQEPPKGEVATRYVHFDELHDIVKKGMLDPEAHAKAATKNTLGFDISPDEGAVRGAGLFNPQNGPLWKIQTELDNVKNPSEIVLTAGKGIETSTPISIDKLYITGPGFDEVKVSTEPQPRFAKDSGKVDSAEVDIILYHGTARKFDEFKSKRQLGDAVEASNIGGNSAFVFFSDNKDVARGYSLARSRNISGEGGGNNIREVPFKGRILDLTENGKVDQKILLEIGTKLNQMAEGKGSDAAIGQKMSINSRGKTFRPINFSDLEGADLFDKILKEYGYDGIKFTDNGIAGGEVNAFALLPDAANKSAPARFAKKTEVEQVFRTDKFNVDEAGQARLKAAQDILGLNTRDIRSWKSVEELAKDVGADPNALLRRVEGKKQLSDVEVEGLRQNVASAHEFLANKYTLMDEATARGDKAALHDIQNKVKMNEQIIDQSVKKLIGAGTELGRGVAIYRKIAALKMDDPTYWYKEAMSLIDDGRKKVRFGKQTAEVEKGTLPPALREAIDSLRNSNDQLGLSYLMSQLKRTNNWDKAVHLWKTGLLTSPTTDLANILGNTTMMALETIKDAPAALTDLLLTKGAEASNKLFGTNFDTTRVKTLSMNMMKKQLAGLYEGGGRAMDYFKTGIDPDDAMGKYDVHKVVNYNNAIAQMYTDFIFRKLGSEDLVFRYGFLRKSLMESAELAVKNMDGPELKSAMEGLPEGVPRTKNELVKFLYQNPSDEASVRAINEAEYGTFQRHNALTDMISGGKQATSPGMRAAAEFLTPFTRTPTNIGLTIWDYTPAGFISELAKQVRSPNKLRIVDSVGRGVLGTSVIALGSALHKEGLMTGNAPETESERKLWEAERKTPNSVFFMGKWRRLDKISPIGNLLTLGAEFDELGQKKTAIEQWTQIGFEGIKSVTDQSFLLGLSNGLKAVTEPDRFASTFVENAVRGLVPSILARIGRGTDDYERETGTMNIPAVLAERIPFLRETLPERMDVLGRKIKTQGGLIGNMFDPFSSRKPSENPVVNELSRLEQPISAPNGALYSDEEYQQLIELRGNMLMQILDNMMEDDQYKLMPDEMKREAIKTIDAAVTREAHSGMRMAMAVRIQKELSEMSPSDKEKKMNEIKKKNSTVYMILQLLDATQPINADSR